MSCYELAAAGAAGWRVLWSCANPCPGENFYRDAKAASRVKMLNGGKAVRDRDGKIIEAAAFQKGEKDALPGRIQPDRRWFGNTRVISQTALDHFRTALSQHKADPYSVLLKRNKLPMGLLQDESKTEGKSVHIVETEPFSDTFGPKAQRKRPRLEAGSLEELGESSTAAHAEPEDAVHLAGDAYHPTTSLMKEPVYAKGTSRRIWGELYKVLDSSDVVIHVLDARDPIGTRCKPVVEYLRKEKAHKHLVYVLNKVDLVPTWVTVSVVLGSGRVSPHPIPHSSQGLLRRFAHPYAFDPLREWKNEPPPPRLTVVPRLGGTAAFKLVLVLSSGERPRGSVGWPHRVGAGMALWASIMRAP